MNKPTVIAVTLLEKPHLLDSVLIDGAQSFYAQVQYSHLYKQTGAGANLTTPKSEGFHWRNPSLIPQGIMISLTP